MPCIDGFLIAVPVNHRDKSAHHAGTFDAIILECGATRVMECRADEAVVFSGIEWPERATGDAGMEKLTKDPRVTAGGDLPFDGKRMIFGGYVPVVDLPAPWDPASRRFPEWRARHRYTPR